MPSTKYHSGDMVMGRWPGSNLYYEVKVMSYDSSKQLYTVMYKDGTELELKEPDIKSQSGFRQSTSRSRSRSRSRSPSRRQSRSRSLGRTSRRSSSRSRELRKDAKPKELLEAKPVENNSNNKHEKKEENDTADKASEKSEGELDRSRASGRYNLRRRKEDAVVKAVQRDELEKRAEDPLPLRTRRWATAKTTELDFGGRVGAFLMMLFLPAVVFTLLLTCQADGSILSFPPPVPPLQAFWSAQALGVVLLWILFQAVLYVLPVGKVAEGMPLKSGKRLKYRMNGFFAFVVTGLAVGVAVYYQVDFSYVHEHFLQLATSTLLVSTLLSVYLYVRSRWAAEDELAPGGNSGHGIYDFFMGHEHNPRIKNFDLKFFFEMRPGLIGWIVINFALLLTEMKIHKLDFPSHAMLLVNFFQFLYIADGLWFEEAILSTMDLTYEGFGFMLAFGDLVWVPFTYTLQAFYLVNHPNSLSLPWAVAIFALNAIGYYVFRKSNLEKNTFRRNPADPRVSHLRTIPTAAGKSLLVSGWWGFVRHPNYLGDLIMAVAWSLPCGFSHLLPYYYLIYFTILLIHRDARDERQCKKKYGFAWEEYCREVRYRIFPGVY
ncbi:delta(14)-sterol reductase LBR [Anguilla rostrata]|uniref:delta(14)-sterol reductase LBR n=1 Tax=Anguilla rostrata TaxID=7938 RepID=UPI0030CE0FEC